MTNDLYLSADIQRVRKVVSTRWRLNAVQGTSKLVAPGYVGFALINGGCVDPES